MSGLRGASVRRARSPSPMLLGELPNELLMLLFSLLRAKDACRLSQAARAWQQRVGSNSKNISPNVTMHGVVASCCSTGQNEQCFVLGTVVSNRGRIFPWTCLPSSLCPCPRSCCRSCPAPVHLSVSSQHAVSHVRCCFIPDAAPGNCCGAMVAARSTDDLWEHLKMVHGVDRGSYMVRARALQWRM